MARARDDNFRVRRSKDREVRFVDIVFDSFGFDPLSTPLGPMIAAFWFLPFLTFNWFLPFLGRLPKVNLII